MNIVQMQCFCAVAKYGSFSQAADALFMSQSSVSKHVAAFEEECGFPLMIRGGKRFELTNEGRLMLRDCNRLLTNYDQVLLLRDNLRGKPLVSASSFSLVGNPDMAHYGIIVSINKFKDLCPDTVIQIREVEDAFCRVALINNECDIAFTSDIGLDRLLYSWQDYCTESLSVIVPLASPLAGKERVYMRDLEGFQIIAAPQKSSLFEFCLNACKGSGLEPQFAFLTTRHSVALDYMECRPEVVYLTPTHSFGQFDQEKYKAIHIEDSPTFQYVIAWKKGEVLSPKIKQYLKFLAAPAPDEFIKEYWTKHLAAVD